MSRKIVLFVLMVVCAGDVFACDSHKIAVASSSWGEGQHWAVGVDGQYSRYGEEAPGSDFDALTLQWSASRKLSDRCLLQMGVPYHDRSLGSDRESGLGDLSVIASGSVLQRTSGSGAFVLDIYAGIKAPTGDDSLLAEESGEEPGHLEHSLSRHAGEVHGHMAESSEEEASHSAGHHLALGSGSWDFPAGFALRQKLDSLVLRFEGQYIFRTEGSYEYRYGDELFARAGAFWSMNSGHNILLGLVASGEKRNASKVDGEVAGGSKEAAYVGPQFQVNVGGRISFMAAYDFPVYHRDEGLGGAADQRVRAGGIWLF